MVATTFREIDLYFTGPAFELIALQHYHELIERELPAIVSARGLPAWNGSGSTPGHIALAQIQQMMVDSMLPMTLRSPLLISLWAIFESALIEMVEFLRIPAKLPFGLADQSIPKHIEPFPKGIINRGLYIYGGELGLSLFVDNEAEQQLRGLYRLRNVLAHAGGRRSSCKSADWDKLSAWAKRESGLKTDGDRVWVEANFVREQIGRVQRATEHIVQQVRQKIQELGIVK